MSVLLWDVYDGLECVLGAYCEFLNDLLDIVFGELQDVIDVMNCLLPG
jgi:hypothetical protein